MPLDPLGVLAGVNPFLSNAFNQVVSLLTGKMTDQTVTLADGLTVLGGITSSTGMTSSAFTADGVLYGSSTNGIKATAVGSSTQVLVGTASAPVFSSTPIVGTLTAISTLQAQSTAPSSAFTKLLLGGSSGPFIAFGASTPTAACITGSLFLNAGGSSTTSLLVCIPNSGGASSSNWDTFSLI